jgi:hypothetical protein
VETGEGSHRQTNRPVIPTAAAEPFLQKEVGHSNWFPNRLEHSQHVGSHGQMFGAPAASIYSKYGTAAQAPMPTNFNIGSDNHGQGQGIQENYADHRHHIPATIIGHSQPAHGSLQQQYPIARIAEKVIFELFEQDILDKFCK